MRQGITTKSCSWRSWTSSHWARTSSYCRTMYLPLPSRTEFREQLERSTLGTTTISPITMISAAPIFYKSESQAGSEWRFLTVSRTSGFRGVCLPVLEVTVSSYSSLSPWHDRKWILHWSIGILRRMYNDCSHSQWIVIRNFVTYLRHPWIFLRWCSPRV